MRPWMIIFGLFMALPPVSAQEVTFVDVASPSGLSSVSSYKDGAGVAAADFDNDGDIDLLIPTAEVLSNHLFVNQGNGTYIDEAVSRGLDMAISTRTGLWIDYDGDGLLDLLWVGDCRNSKNTCTDEEVIRLFRQNPSGNFTDVTSSSGLLTGYVLSVSELVGGLAASDLENDGYMDVVISFYKGNFILFENNDGTGFSPRMLTTKKDFYYQPVLHDFNDDGVKDIYVTVDGPPNELWVKKNGIYMESASDYGLDNPESDMGTTLGDFDNDGDIDLYISNVTIPNQEWYNILYVRGEQHESPHYQDQASSYGVGPGGWGWGVSFFDANNDGLLDLAETNGFTAQYTMPSRFWLQTSSGFTDQSAACGFDQPYDGNSLISMDYDRDGDQDLLETIRLDPSNPSGLKLWENQVIDGSSHFLTVKPRMLGTNQYAIGSTVKIKVGEVSMMRPITAGTSFYGQEPAEAHFGLGTATNVDEVQIIWPDNTISTYVDVQADQFLTLTDEQVLHTPSRLDVTATDINTIQLKWIHQSTKQDAMIVQRSENPDFSTFQEFVLNSNDVTFSDDQVLENQVYHYRILAKKGLEYSPPSNSIETKAQEFIQTPEVVDINVPSPFRIELTWEDRSNNETGFEIHRSTSSDFSEQVVFSTEKLFFNDTSVLPYTKYFYRVRAINERSFSLFAETIQLTTPDFIYSPSDFLMRPEINSWVLSWEDQADNESGYQIERSLTEDFLFNTIVKVGKNITRYVDTDAVPGVAFYYRIKAYNDRVTSEYVYAEKPIVTTTLTPEIAIEIYPNPITNWLAIKTPKGVYSGLDLSIYSPSGKRVMRMKYHPEDTGIPIDLKSGIYILIIQENQQVLFKQKILVK